jgi:hypothetical protein
MLGSSFFQKAGSSSSLPIKHSWMLCFVFLAADVCFVNSAQAGCDWLHRDGWYSRIQQMSQSNGTTEGWRQSRLDTQLEYVDGLLRFRIYPPSVPCSGPQCRKGKAGSSELPASTRLVRNSTAGSAIVPKAWLGQLPTLEWLHYLDDRSISWTTEPTLPPPRNVH